MSHGQDLPMASILMGDWCSEELTSKPNETAAIVMMKITERLDEKLPFLATR
jgi:hypothetical protein